MRMGNYLGVHALPSTVATQPRRFGIAHVTVVPTNYDPDEDHSEDRD